MTNADHVGTVLHQSIVRDLDNLGYMFVPRTRFVPSHILEQPIYTRRFYVGKSIYEVKQFCDFIVYHPERWPANLIIESKWQKSGGTVDEKFPYLALNIQNRYPCPTILVLDGGGYKEGAERWIRSQAGHGNFNHVFNRQEFAAWINAGNL